MGKEQADFSFLGDGVPKRVGGRDCGDMGSMDSMGGMDDNNPMTSLPPEQPPPPSGSEPNEPYYVPVEQDVGILRIKKEDGTHCVIAWDGPAFRRHRCLVHDVWVFFRIAFQPGETKTETETEECT